MNRRKLTSEIRRLISDASRRQRAAVARQHYGEAAGFTGQRQAYRWILNWIDSQDDQTEVAP